MAADLKFGSSRRTTVPGVSHKHEAVNVYLVGPGRSHKGGISRYAAYLLDAVQRSTPIRFVEVDTYDERRALLYLKFVWCLARVAVLPRGTRIHYNLSIGGSSLRKGLLSLVSIVRRHRFVVHVHGSGYPSFYASAPSPVRALIKTMARRANKVIVLSEADRAQLSELVGLAPDKVMVVPNGVPAPSSGPTKPDLGHLSLLFLGDLGPRKGASTLVKALAKVEPSLEWNAVLAGTGRWQEVQELANGLGIGDRLVARPWLAPDEVVAILRASDILVLPSTAEGLPLSVLEGMAHSLAVIASPVGGIGEALSPDCGILVDPTNTDELARVVDELLRSPHRVQSLKTAAFERWASKYSIGENLSAIAKIHAEEC